MSAHENGSRKIPQTHSPLMSAEELIGQYALAQDCLTYDWRHNSRWNGIERPYTAGNVLGLRGSIHIEHTLARLGAERLWELLQTEPYVNSLGAMTGNQAVQQVQAGLKALYVRGWQGAAGPHHAGQTDPRPRLDPAGSGPNRHRATHRAW